MDGERNLKPKLAPKITQYNLFNLLKNSLENKVTVSAIDPIKDIYKFEG